MVWVAQISRVGIVNGVRAVAGQCQDPTAKHLKAVIKIMSYLHATKDLGITYVRGWELDVRGYTNVTVNTPIRLIVAVRYRA